MLWILTNESITIYKLGYTWNKLKQIKLFFRNNLFISRLQITHNKFPHHMSLLKSTTSSRHLKHLPLAHAQHIVSKPPLRTHNFQSRGVFVCRAVSVCRPFTRRKIPNWKARSKTIRHSCNRARCVRPTGKWLTMVSNQCQLRNVSACERTRAFIACCFARLQWTKPLANSWTSQRLCVLTVFDAIFVRVSDSCDTCSTCT